MSYTIRYGGKHPLEKSTQGNGLITAIITLSLIGTLVLGIRYAFPEAIGSIRSILLPGFDSTAQLAFSDLLAAVKQGSDLQDAVSAFCREIIANGQLP